jgi:hypothetical protein
MKKFLLILFLLPVSGSLSAQVNFGYQANGLNTAFYITQAGQFYEGVRWVFGDGTETWDGSDTVFHTYPAPGAYEVCVYGYPMPISPVDSMCKTVDLQSIGIEEHNNDFVFFLEEPGKRLIVKSSLPNLVSTNAILVIYNNNGRKVFEKSIWNNSEIIDLQSFKSGNYFINLKYLNKTITKKITLI